MNDYWFHEDYQRACDRLCEALRECGRYRALERIEFVPLPGNSSEPMNAICWFKGTKATVNIRCDDVWGMYWDIINHLNDIIERRQSWG